MASGWQPDPVAVNALEELRIILGPGREPVGRALLYALNHPCSGPGVQRMLLEDGAASEKENQTKET